MSLHWPPPNMFFWMSSQTAKRLQQAALSGVLAIWAGDALGDCGLCHEGGGQGSKELLEGHFCEVLEK